MTTREVTDTSVALLGDWLGRWRQAVGVSQRVLAARAGIDQSGLSRVERGLQVCGALRLARIMCTLDEFGQQGSMGPVPPPSFRRRSFDRLDEP
jgi:transcriptional regulator with XRE-family HTH domain